MAIIDQLANSKSLQRSAKTISKHSDIWQDLFHHTLLTIYDLGEERVVGIHKEGRIEGYVAVVMHHEYHNTYSTFYKLYRQSNVEYIDQDIIIESDGEPYRPTQFDLDLCREYFGKNPDNKTWRITPERIAVARAMDAMRKEDNQNDRFHYRTAILELYIELGGIRPMARATGIDRKTLSKDLKATHKRLKKG